MLWITADIIKTAVRHSHELWTLTVNFLVSQFGRPSPPKCSGGGFVFVKHDTVVGVLDQILGRRLLFQKHWSGRGKSSRSSLTPRDLCFSARLRRVTGRRPLWFSLRDFVPCLCPHTPSLPPIPTAPPPPAGYSGLLLLGQVSTFRHFQNFSHETSASVCRRTLQ